MSKIIETIGAARSAVIVVKHERAPRYEVRVQTHGAYAQAVLLTDDLGAATRELVAQAWPRSPS
jgi:hypothetical protein